MGRCPERSRGTAGLKEKHIPSRLNVGKNKGIRIVTKLRSIAHRLKRRLCVVLGLLASGHPFLIGDQLTFEAERGEEFLGFSVSDSKRGHSLSVLLEENDVHQLGSK
ncbi:MAG: hypothetical protein BWY82_02609 [Verrucomicrobia bacterium ADurb.Bin474]|nr:MAG: hypothetical protein BWY82_02609 [Verrucomicrobia bacterium ADurb.Bin474]